MRVIYVKENANYPFGIGYEYEASKYKEGWIIIDSQLFREEYFQVINIDSEISKYKNDLESLKIELLDINDKIITLERKINY